MQINLMRGKRIAVLTGLVVGFGAANVQLTQAKETERSEAVMKAEAKVSLSQAIATAEQHSSGKAGEVELEDENGSLVYSVEVSSSQGKTTEVWVDAKTGKVLSAKAE